MTKIKYKTKKQAIIIFTRLPIAGRTKTRLQPFLSPEQCARLHSCFLKDIYNACQCAGADILFFTAPKDKQGMIAGLLGDVILFTQCDGSLEERMEDAFARVFDLGYTDVLLIGTDIPELQKEHINAAFEELNRHDVAFGRSVDGGYYLVGLKQRNKLIFEEENYSRPEVLNCILSKLKHKNITVGFTESLLDIDTIDDLYSLKKHFEENKYKPEHTSAYINKLLEKRDVFSFAE